MDTEEQNCNSSGAVSVLNQNDHVNCSTTKNNVPKHNDKVTSHSGTSSQNLMDLNASTTSSDNHFSGLKVSKYIYHISYDNHTSIFCISTYYLIHSFWFFLNAKITKQAVK